MCCSRAGRPGWHARLHHMHDDGLIRLASALVSANAYGQVEIHSGVVHARRVNGIHSQFLKESPVPQSDVGVQQRNFLRRGQRLFLLVGKFFADVWDHDMPARQDRVLRLGGVDLAAAGVADFDFSGAGGVAQMLHANGCAVQANAHGRTGVVELRIVRFGRRSHPTTEFPGIASGISLRTSRRAMVALPSGKWKKYFSASSLGMRSRFMPLPGDGSSFRPSNPGKSNPHASCAGNRIDANTEQSVRKRLVKLDNVFMNSRNVFQKAGITHAREFGFLLIRGQAGEIILRFLIQALQVALGLVGNRSIRQELFQPLGRRPRCVLALAAAARDWDS